MEVVCPNCHTKNRIKDPPDTTKEGIYICGKCKHEWSAKEGTRMESEKEVDMDDVFYVETKEEKERKREAWEAFNKLSLQEKIEHLWKSIYKLQQHLSIHEDPWLHPDQTDLYEFKETTNRRFKTVGRYLESLGASTDEIARLALLKSSGPTNKPCLNCGERRVFRKISRESPTEEYILECRSCGWREEEKVWDDD